MTSWIKLIGTQTGQWTLGINGVTLARPQTQTVPYTLTLPENTGTSGQVLTTDGTGVLSWTTSGGSYTLPAATASVLGGIKVGSGLAITADGTLSATGGGGGGGAVGGLGEIQFSDGNGGFSSSPNLSWAGGALATQYIQLKGFDNNTSLQIGGPDRSITPFPTGPGGGLSLNNGYGAGIFISGTSNSVLVRNIYEGSGTFPLEFRNRSDLQITTSEGNIVFRSGFTPTEKIRMNRFGAIGLNGANYGTTGQVLTSAGSNAPPTWTTVGGGGGGITSVGLFMPAGFTVNNSPLTSSGNIDVSTTLNGIVAGNGAGFTTVNIGSGLSYSGGTLSATGGGGGGATPGGIDGSIQYKSSTGTFTGSTNIVYFESAKNLMVDDMMQIGAGSTLNVGVTIDGKTGSIGPVFSNSLSLNAGFDTTSISLDFNDVTIRTNFGDLIYKSGTSTSSAEKFRVQKSGAIGLNGANYGTPGQVLTSAGPGQPATWTTVGGGGSGTVTSVGLTMPAGFSVGSSPVTDSGTINVTTDLSGMVKGTGSGFSNATAGVDFQEPINLTTIGSSGAATLVGNTLNIPNYALSNDGVLGPVSSTEFAIPTFADATGKLLTNNSLTTINSSGIITATGFNSTSTARIKSNIQDLSSRYLELFDLLEPKEYDRLDNNQHEFGFIAEDMYKIFPEIVVKDINGIITGIDYTKLPAILTAKIKQQKKEIAELKESLSSVLDTLAEILKVIKK